MSNGGDYSPFRSILLVLTHDFIIICVYTDRRAVTDMNGKTRTLRCAPFLCRLRRSECCMLGAPSSQPTVPPPELLPARLVIHRQTSAHERRKWTRSVQSRSGILAVDNGRAPHSGARHGEAVAREGGRYAPVRRVSSSEPLGLRTHRRRGRSRPLQLCARTGHASGYSRRPVMH